MNLGGGDWKGRIPGMGVACVACLLFAGSELRYGEVTTVLHTAVRGAGTELGRDL